MFDAPIRRRIKNYPKDFTPPSGYLTSNEDSKPTISSANQYNEQYSFNAEIHRKQQQLNFSTQLSNNNKQLIKNNLYTINPQQGHKIILPQIEGQIPLRHNIARRKPYINPDMLLKPRIEMNPNQQLIQRQEDEDQISNNTPGSIRKNLDPQKPLQQEQPSYVNVFPREFVSSRKVSSNQNMFYQSLKAQNVSFSNLKTKRLPIILRNGNSQAEGVFKLAKKQEPDLSQSHLQTRKQKSQDKKSLIEFGYLLQQKRVDKLKAHINQIAFEKSKNKPKLKFTNVTQSQIQEQSDLQKTNNRKSQSQGNNMLSNRDFYPQLGYQIYQKQQNIGMGTPRQLYKNNSEYDSRIRAFSTPRSTNFGNNKKISISYKTSLSQLKQIYKNIVSHQSIDVEVLVPRSLMTVNFDKDSQKQQLYSQAGSLFQSLGIPVDNLTIKRYSNCILMVSRNICILWHYGGKVYLGGWQVQYLDEGVKHGLGLEWVPNKYVYYGEYCESKKQGLGIMKTTEQTFIGEWMKGKRTNNGSVISRNGKISHPSGSFNNHQYNGTEYEQFESDPFL